VIDFLNFLIYGFTGFIGAFLSQIVNKGFLELPSIKNQNGEKFLDLGCIAVFIIGIVAGIIGDANPANALTFGFFGESILKALFDKTNGSLKIKIQAENKPEEKK
jgi:uncharacterized membrane protein YeaQ/YmgE (transglycosylase-associated protein family)